MNPQSPAVNEQAPEQFQARFETSAGTFVVDVDRELAPKGADRFYNLVKSGYYDGNRFFRVVPNFIVQFGMHGDPQVSQTWYEQRIEDDPVQTSNERGTVTFAKTNAPNSRTTQLFINLGSNANLDRMQFAPFGRVNEGMDVVDQITAEYGEQPNQGRIMSEGNAYLGESFPNLDYIIKASIQE